MANGLVNELKEVKPPASTAGISPRATSVHPSASCSAAASSAGRRSAACCASSSSSSPTRRACSSRSGPRSSSRPCSAAQPRPRRCRSTRRPTSRRSPASHAPAVRALGPLRRPRARGPGFARDRRVALPGHGRVAPLRARRGLRVLVGLHLLRDAALRAVLRVGVPLGCSSASSGVLLRAAGYRRRAVLVGLGRAHRGGRPRARRGQPGRSTRSASCRSRRGPRTGLQGPRPARATLEHHFDDDRRGADRRPRLPAGARPSTWSTAATATGSACASRPRRWRSSWTGSSSCPARRSRCSSSSRRSSRASTSSSSARSTSSVASLILLVAVAGAAASSALAIKLSSRGPVIYRSMRPGIGGEPFACFKFRTMYHGRRARQAELEEHNEAGGAIFKIRNDPRVTPVGALPAALVARRAAAALQRAARRDVARRPAAAAPARLRPARGLAPQALPRAARHDRPVAGVRAARSSTSTSWCGSTSSTSSAGRSSSTCRSC